MTWIEVAGFLTGALCVLLVVRQNIVNFPVGIANCVFYFVVFTQAGLYADAGLQVVFLVLGVQGWWLWLRGGPDRTPLKVQPLPTNQLVGVLVAVAASTALLTVLLLQLTESTVPFWDALTTSLSLGAQWLLNRKHIANWYFWIIADVLFIALYFHKDLRLTSLLYAFFLGLCFLGVRQWRASVRTPDLVSA